MRLLNVDCYQLVEYFEPHIPRYAILSHRWKDEEVFYADIVNDDYKHKAGFRKIGYACREAKEKKLDYLWVDTCCIDKTSSAELSEAINSMFRWYEKSTECYACLSDVVCTLGDDGIFLEQFQASAWFTRGWTLQKLLAPKHVYFFDRNWRHFGDKITLARHISTACGIDENVLRNPYSISRLRDFSVARKMSWAARRKTTRLEDQAYCLMGLFEVNMPLLYGEGRRAFVRLQEEISKSSPDLSILAWKQPLYALDEASLFGLSNDLLANSPADFVDCGRIVPSPQLDGLSDDLPIFTWTSRGLSIDQPTLLTTWPNSSSNEILLCLGCREDNTITKAICLKLVAVRTNGYYQVGWRSDERARDQRVIAVDILGPRQSPVWSRITIARDSTPPALLHRPSKFWHTHVWVRLPEGEDHTQWRAIDFYPDGCWNKESLTMDTTLLRSPPRSAIFDPDGGEDPSMSETQWIRGAIALSTNVSHNVVVRFTLKVAGSSSTNQSHSDTLPFTISEYRADQFPEPLSNLGSRNAIERGSTAVSHCGLTVRYRKVEGHGIRIAVLQLETSESDTVMLETSA